jgi:hypothetical protein
MVDKEDANGKAPTEALGEFQGKSGTRLGKSEEELTAPLYEQIGRLQMRLIDEQCLRCPEYGSSRMTDWLRGKAAW